MTVKSADKKPEKYVAPDGKTKIRMVPMDKEVVKSEAYDEPQGQAKRMMSPLQKIRMDKEKADRDRDGKLKSTNKTLKALRKESVEEETELNELTAAEKKLVNQMYDKKGNLTPLGKKVMNHGKKSADGSPLNKGMKEEVEQLDEISKKTAQSYLDKTKDDDAWSGTRKSRNRLRGSIHAVGIKRKKASVDEVLDTPKAMDSYHNKAKTQSDRARNSATAKIVRGTKDISKEKDVIRKREKGMDMAANARIKQFRKSIGKGYAGAVKEDLNPYLKHPADKLKDKHASFSRQIGDLQTKKLKGAKNPSIDQEIAKYQQKLRHVKNAMKSEATIQNEEAPKKKKVLTYKDMKRAIASIKPPKKKPTLPKAPWDKKDD